MAYTEAEKSSSIDAKQVQYRCPGMIGTEVAAWQPGSDSLLQFVVNPDGDPFVQVREITQKPPCLVPPGRDDLFDGQACLGDQSTNFPGKVSGLFFE
jgi:hypothetical protein